MGMVSGLCLGYQGWWSLLGNLIVWLDGEKLGVEGCEFGSIGDRVYEMRLKPRVNSSAVLMSVWPFLNIITDILLGTHWESGAVTFWSHAVSLPLASNAIFSWKFCHMVHKLLRDGHPNTLRDSQGHVPSIKQMGTLWGSLHDRYGHIVALYAKFLCIKIEFHCKHKAILPDLAAPDEVLERAIAVDINEVFETTGEVLEYMDAALVLQETVFRQLESNNTSATTAVGQCRLAPLVPLLQDCSPLYHFLVKLLFKLHSRIPMDALLDHRERFRDQFNSLSQFFEKARSIEFFKAIIQIPDFPDTPPNFLRAASLADYVKPVVVHNQLPEDDDTETQVEGNPVFHSFNQYDGPVQREKEVESMRKELEAMRPEMQMFKAEAQRAVVHLKDQVNKLEAELEDQRTCKQMAMVENEQLRMEVEALRAQTAVAASMQASVDDSRVQTAQMHFTRLKEKHAELVTRHADLMRKNADMVKQLASTQQAQEELVKAKQQIAEGLEHLKQENSTKLEAQQAEIIQLRQELQTGKAEIINVQSALQSKEKAGDQLSGVLLGLQAEKETLMRSLKEQEAELANLRQSSQLNQTMLQQERDKTQKEMSSLQSQLQEKVSREIEQQMELEKLKKELELKRAEALSVQSALQSKEAAGDQLSSVLVGLQAEKEILMRTLKEQEAELAKLRQAALLHQITLQQERDKYQKEIDSLKSQLQEKLQREQEQQLEIARLKRELEERRAEATSAQNALHSKETAGHEMSSLLVGLQAQKETLMRSLKEQEAELANLRVAAQQHQTMLQQEKDKTQREMSSLQSQLQAKLSRETELQQKLQEEQFCLLQCAVVEAEGIILDALSKVDDPMHVRCVCTPEYLINRAEITLVSIDKMQQSHAGYLRNLDDASGLLRSVTQFSHLAADTIVNGAAASHSAPTDQADSGGLDSEKPHLAYLYSRKIFQPQRSELHAGLTDNCRDCATHCLQFLKELKLQATLQRADPSVIRYTVQRILNQATDLRRNDTDVQKAELADMVDKEMAATSTAIEEAVLRMEEILSQARRDTSGLKLEVNQSILGSCSDLMKAIHMLVTAATDLQKDIVESGRGAGSVKDFYAKNSCWTEGLISASKAVGWGATQMVDSADKVVTDRGKYEELIVCSHEIAASTAQLVAASKVKADRSNKKLNTLLQASRHVNDMAAVVVTSTKAGQMQIEDKDPMDFSGMSLIKLKTEEMETQVKVLELENQLSNERQRLGELRKKHYELAGVPLDQTAEKDFDGFVSVLPPVMPEPPLPEPPKPEPSKNPTSKRPSIFQKSGSLLKNKFR
ncbi:huntingtin-interacting protein 1-related protein-like isoform X1 [Ictalurus furcatus]|uniref:huntingtin-interacting protein 1-related protein-like isoform X1 n=1 Tax=Ictalurus furcatus TaxID=66913 RepID=UPI0023508A15|nr:huntingtin-interacting protein 1-related protein-like isoform X1 [Ictalurus furcatus]